MQSQELRGLLHLIKVKKLGKEHRKQKGKPDPQDYRTSAAPYSAQIFKGDTQEVGAVLGLFSEKLDTGTAFDKYREKLKGYAERNIDNAKGVMCVVTDMEDPIKTFEEDIILKYLDEYEAKSILKKKRLELAL